MKQQKSASCRKKAMTDIKILIVGPQNSGKTALANYIADAVHNAENPSQAPTKPTVGARILEFDRQLKKGNQGVSNLDDVTLRSW